MKRDSQSMGALPQSRCGGDSGGGDAAPAAASMPARMSVMCRTTIHVYEPLVARSDVDAALARLLPPGLRLNDATAAFIRCDVSASSDAARAALGWSREYARAMACIAHVMPNVLGLMDKDPSLVVYAHVSPATRHLAYMAMPTHVKEEIIMSGTLAFPPGVVVFHGRRSMFFTHEDFSDTASAQRLLRQVVTNAPLACCKCGASCRAHTACCRLCAAPMCGECDRVTQCPMCSCELAPY